MRRKNKVEIGKVFNKYYKTKVKRIIQSIPKNAGSPTNKLNNRMYKWKGVHTNPNKLTLKRTTLKEVLQVICELTNSTAM